MKLRGNEEDILKIKAYRWDIPFFYEQELDFRDWELSRDNKQFLKKQVYLNEDRSLVCAAAGNGKTHCAAILGLWSCTVLADALDYPYEIGIMGGSRDQSKICYNFLKDYIDASSWIRRKVDGEPLKSETNFKNGAQVYSVASGPKSIRGKHPDAWIIDEAAEVDEDLMKAAIPRVDTSRYSRLILLSTPHIYGSYFVHLWDNADDFGYRKYSWNSWDTPWIDDDKIERQKNELDEKSFKEEYLGEPVPPGGTAIGQDDIGRSIIEQTPKPDIEGHTILGIDYGFVHPTAIVILQLQGKMMYVLETRMWKEKKFMWIQEQVKKLYDKYEVDAIYADRSHQEVNEQLLSSGLHIKEVSFTNTKTQMISNMRFMFERYLVKIPQKNKDLIKQVMSYTEETKKGDDLVDALMLALWGMKQSGRRPSKHTGKMYSYSKRGGES